MKRVVVLCCLLAVGAFQSLFAEDFKFKVTPSRDYSIGLTVFGGPTLMLDACWSSSKADLDWIILCEYPDGIGIAAISESDEEKCEDLQVGIFGGNGGLDCAASLVSAGGTGKGNGAFRFTGTERSVRAARVSLDHLPRFRDKLEQFKAAKRKRKAAQ